MNNGHTSKEGFRYFMGWLISRGEEVYKSAVKNPDSLADVCDLQKRNQHHFERFLHASNYAYKALTKRDMNDVLPMFSPASVKISWSPENKSSMLKHCPKLLAQFEGLQHVRLLSKKKGKRM